MKFAEEKAYIKHYKEQLATESDYNWNDLYKRRNQILVKMSEDENKKIYESQLMEKENKIILIEID